MARPPAGPMGNSPRDVRDDAVGVPADDVNAPEPPRWPPKPKKITKDTFHAKVSGGKSSKRADRRPHFRRGGFVSGFASGGSIEKREQKPGEDKNDPFAKQNLRRGGNVKKKYADGGEIEIANKPPVMPDKPFEHTGSDEGGPGLSEENTAQKVARGWNTLNRGLGRPLQTGAASVQRLSDMSRAEEVSRAVPRRREEGVAGPGLGGIGRRKSGGDVTGSFTSAEEKKIGASAFRGGKYENEPRQERLRTFNEPMGQDASEKAAYSKNQPAGYKAGGKLSAAQRQSLPKSDFALPGKGQGPKGAGSGSYPINDPSHARNALARASGKPVEAAVRAKVKAKYPGIGQK